MKIYTTLENERFDQDLLPPAHKSFLVKVFGKYSQNPSWDEFGHFWLGRGKKLWKGITGTKLIALPLYKICQDLEARLGIQQGYTRERDYRDDLDEIIRAEFPSRYQFCAMTATDQGFLSNVLKKRKNFSIAQLEEKLRKIGYRLSIQKEEVRKS
jgi:hypothetical protein